MASAVASSFPARLRSRRRALGLTLRDIAAEARLSIGFISQVERGLATPSLTSLVGIARALDLDPGALLGIPPSNGATMPAAKREPFSVTRSGPTYERISTGDGAMRLNGLVTHFPPGYAKAEITRHEGEELFYVLSGELELLLNGKRTRLKPGDAAHYSSSLPHAMRNPTDEPASVLWVGTMDLFHPDPGRPHPRMRPVAHENDASKSQAMPVSQSMEEQR